MSNVTCYITSGDIWSYILLFSYTLIIQYLVFKFFSNILNKKLEELHEIFEERLEYEEEIQNCKSIQVYSQKIIDAINNLFEDEELSYREKVNTALIWTNSFRNENKTKTRKNMECGEGAEWT